MLSLLVFILVFLGFWYLGSPLIVWAKQRQGANPQLQCYGKELQDPNFQFLTATATQLQSMGFDLIGYFGLLQQNSHTNTFTAYLIHCGNGDSGAALMVATSAGVRATAVSFFTRFVDQSSITTGNGKTPSVFLRPRSKPLYCFPWIDDPAHLYRIHQQLILRERPEIAQDVPQPGTEQQRLVDSMRQEMQDQQAAKILRLEPAGNCYRPTLLGAYRMTWRVLFPFKQITAIAKQAKARRLEKSLWAGVGTQPIHPGL